MDSPTFLYAGKRKNEKNFVAVTKADIEAVIRFLYKRGMWSKYHYTQWLEELKDCQDPEMLHLWWDSIVGGAMFETEPMLESRLEAMEEFEEDKVEQEKMKKRQKHNLAKKTKTMKSGSMAPSKMYKGN